MPLEHLVDASWVDPIGRCDVMLVLASPMPKPYGHRIIQSEAVGRSICPHRGTLQLVLLVGL